jgi:hypothetical protein
MAVYPRNLTLGKTSRRIAGGAVEGTDACAVHNPYHDDGRQRRDRRASGTHIDSRAVLGWYAFGMNMRVVRTMKESAWV